MIIFFNHFYFFLSIIHLNFYFILVSNSVVNCNSNSCLDSGDKKCGNYKSLTIYSDSPIYSTSPLEMEIKSGTSTYNLKTYNIITSEPFVTIFGVPHLSRIK